MATFESLAAELSDLAGRLRDCDNGLDAIAALEEPLHEVAQRLEAARERLKNILKRFEGQI